ncbi:hypothetical protein [Sphingomonas phage Birtae]|nr:hypothetical protein [Sphingomonas phage Birtae]
MIKFKTCRKCDGAGSVAVTRNIAGGGLFSFRKGCERCDGRGMVAYDTWTRPTLIFAAIVAAYFIWQIFIR